jgi:hypothetical protein
MVAAALAAALCFLLTSGSTRSSTARARRSTAAVRAHPGVELLAESHEGTVLRLSSDGGRREVSALVRVPDTGAVEFEVSDLAVRDEEGALLPVGRDALDAVSVSEPAIMRDLRLVRVTFAPARLPTPLDISASSATVMVRTTSAPGANEKRSRVRPRSPAFERIYESEVLNYERDDAGASAHAAMESRAGREVVGSRYLIVTDAMLAGEVDSLVAWKSAKGLLPKVVTPAAGVWSRYELKLYIDNAYNTWDIPPEFVLFLGDTELVPTGGGSIPSDNYFADVEGDDYLLDIIVGRIPAEDASQCRTMLAKTLSYDRPWIHGDGDWPLSGTLLLLEDDDGSGSDEIYYEDTRLALGLMRNAGFAPIDTLFQGDYITTNMVIESLSAGRGLVNYRGVSSDFWPAPFSIWPGNVECGWKLPVVVSATCLSGNYYEDVAIGEAFLRAGDEGVPRGAAAFFGTSTSGQDVSLSIKRSAVDQGFWRGAFGPGRTLGEACAAGKTNLYELLDDREEYEGWNLLGDPELSLWTAPRAPLAADHETIIPLTATSLPVSVTVEGQPVQGAEVTLDGMPSVFASGVTDDTGMVDVPLALVAPCTLHLTVVAKNTRPYDAAVRVLAAGPYVAVADTDVTDASGGNGDGFVSPGESVSVSLALANLGDQQAPGVEARLRCADAGAAVVDSTVQFGDVAPDGVVWGDSDFTLDVDPDWAGGYDIPLTLEVTYGDSVDVLTLPPLETVSGDLALSQAIGDDGSPGGDGDGSLEPGEVAGIELVLDCDARSQLTNIGGVLTSRSPSVSVTSSAATFPDVSTGGQSDNAAAPFIVSVAPDALPGDAKLFLRVTADAPTYAYAETLALNLDIAEVAPLHPTGPDQYGYYAYDSTDTLYAAAPMYEWAEIADSGNGLWLEEVSESDNGVEELAAPFIIQSYGLIRESLWVSSNGFVSVYAPNGSWSTNSGIPSLEGPAGMFAPFWDDLDPSAGGDVYVWFDPYEHRYIIEYDEVRHRDSEETETFEVMIYDPEYYPTPTGDAEVAFLYKDVSDPAGCTVGIEHPYETDGLEFLFDGDYGPYAAPLSDGLAVLFTTATPETLTFPWVVLNEAWFYDSAGGDGDGVPEPGEEISLVLQLRNDGPVAVADLDLTLTETVSGVTVLDAVGSVPDIEPGGTGHNGADPFSFAIDAAVQEELITLWARPGTTANTRQGAIRIDLQLGPPASPDAAVLRLSPCYPNPFGNGTSISFNMPEDGRAIVRVYDVAGRLVGVVDDSFREAGPHVVPWDGTNETGESVASGVYFIRLEAAGDAKTRKAVLLR